MNRTVVNRLVTLAKKYGAANALWAFSMSVVGEPLCDLYDDDLSDLFHNQDFNDGMFGLENLSVVARTLVQKERVSKQRLARVMTRKFEVDVALQADIERENQDREDNRHQ